jgi:signal transduction histidine kinase
MSTDVAILAVDDTAQNLVALGALLARPGLRMLQASSADEALDLLLREDIALALIDVQMPGTSGLELAEIMRGTERTSRIPIIFLTAAISDPIRTFRGYEAGAVDFLHKPVDPVILRSKVDVFVALHEQSRQLAGQLALVEEALKTNELFAAVLGHDLRDPLAAVTNYAQALKATNPDPRVVRIAEGIQASTQRMARMISQLLDVARIRAGQFELHRTDTDLGRLCQRIVDEVETGRATRRVQVAIDGDCRCAVDADRIAQVVSNLVGNALRHGDPSQPIVISVDGTDSGSVRLCVANGGEIPPEVLRGHFHPFRAGQRERNTDGLGLGLHIVERFVSAHGGTIDVHSKGGRTEVVLHLPRAAAPARGG